MQGHCLGKVDILFTSLKMDLLILYAVVASSGMNKDGADVSAQPSSAGSHGSQGSIGRAVDIVARQIVRSGLLFGRSESMCYSLPDAVDDLPGYIQRSYSGSHDIERCEAFPGCLSRTMGSVKNVALKVFAGIVG